MIVEMLQISPADNFKENNIKVMIERHRPFHQKEVKYCCLK